jgi:hypothetical protein
MPYALLIPILALLIPIVAILTTHQRRMAELIHGSHRTAAGNAEIATLRQEMQELKEVVHQQTIAIDNISRLALPSEPVSNRLSGV